MTLPNTDSKEYLLLTSHRGGLYTHRFKRNATGYQALAVNIPVRDINGDPLAYDANINEVRVDALNDLSTAGRNKFYIALNKRESIVVYELPVDQHGARRAKSLKTFRDQYVTGGQTIDYANPTDPAHMGKLWLSLGAMKLAETQDRLGFYVSRGRGTSSWTSSFGNDAVFVMGENLFIGADDSATCYNYSNTGVVTSFARTVPAYPNEPYTDQNHTTSLEYAGTSAYTFRRTCCYGGTGMNGAFNFVSNTPLGAGSTNPVAFGDIKAKYGTTITYLSIVDNTESRLYSKDGTANPVWISTVAGTTPRAFPSTPMTSSITYTYVAQTATAIARDNMYYEVGDHLGNVRAVVTGNMIASGSNVLNDRMNATVSGWTSTGTAVIESYRAKLNGSLSKTLTVVNAATYRLSFRYQGTVSVGGNTLTSTNEAWGEYIFTASSTSTTIGFVATNTVYLDDIRLDRIDNKAVQIVSLKDYYPFGAVMKGRSYTSSGGRHKYGFNGKEYDEEDEYYDYGARLYDASMARFATVDPLRHSFPDLTPYQFAENSPILNLDLDGFEAIKYTDATDPSTPTQKVVTSINIEVQKNDIVDMNQQDYRVVSVYNNYLYESYYLGKDNQKHILKRPHTNNKSQKIYFDELSKDEVAEIKTQYRGPIYKGNNRPYIDATLNPVDYKTITLREMVWKKTEQVKQTRGTNNISSEYNILGFSLDGSVPETEYDRVANDLIKDPNATITLNGSVSTHEFMNAPEGHMVKASGVTVAWQRAGDVAGKLTESGFPSKNITYRGFDSGDHTVGGNLAGVKVTVISKTINSMFYNKISFVKSNPRASKKKIVPFTGSPSDYQNGRKK